MPERVRSALRFIEPVLVRFWRPKRFEDPFTKRSFANRVGFAKGQVRSHRRCRGFESLITHHLASRPGSVPVAMLCAVMTFGDWGLAGPSTGGIDTATWVVSSVGRALRLHRRCRGFESLTTHHATRSEQVVPRCLQMPAFATHPFDGNSDARWVRRKRSVRRGGSGNLNSRDKWIFCATAA